MTECNTKTRLDFHPKFRVDLSFDAPDISTDGGAVLIRQVDDHLGLTEELAALVPDERDPDRVEHPRVEQMRQRVYQVVAGYEDQNDADRLRDDPLWKVATGRAPEDRGLSSQPTLSLFENAVGPEDVREMRHALIRRWIDSIADDATVVELDVDASGFECHGAQQLSFFSGFLGAHVYLPLLIFDGTTGQLISIRLRPGSVGDSTEAEDDLREILEQLQQLRPDVEVVVRADSAFGSPRIYRVLEEFGASYVIGVIKNSALERKLSAHMKQATESHHRTGKRARQFAGFMHQANSWRTERKVIGKAEVTDQGENPRFVITDLEEFPERLIYRAYCQRGLCEQWIGEFKSGLNGDRMSCSKFVANDFRCVLFQIAYRLLWSLRTRIRDLSSSGANDPEEQVADGASATSQLFERLARAQFDTLRLLLLKVAVMVKQSTRRIHLQMPQCFVMAPVFGALAADLNEPRAG